MWQEYARHWYLRHGRATATGVRREQASVDASAAFDRTMACVGETLAELESDGWLVNQTRMWLSSEWAVRRGGAWRDGEEYFFRHLPRRLAGGEPDGVAVDRRGRIVEALRVQSLAGGAPGAWVVSGLRAPTRLPDRGLAR